ncbi:MAG TPA: PAS domain-containing protein, partial [Armatimonadota bacterium]|nr:PAS domain-containing protein [Armatimonadota bacterium]
RHVETLQSLTDGFIAFDRDLRYVFVNPRGEALVRRPRAELLGRRIDEVFPDLLESEFYRQARKALEDGASAVVEEYYAPLDTWFESHLYPSPHGLSCVVRDVTAERRSQREREELLAREQAARRELEAALAAQQEGEAQLRFALEAGRMGAWEWDIRSGAIRWSDNLEPLHGLAPGSFAGTFEAFQELIHPEDRERVQDALAVALDESGGYDIEFRVVWPDESIRWMAGRGMVIRDAEGRPARMVGLGVDITARKEAQAAVVRTNERYRLATAAVDGVVYDFDIDSGRVERSEGLVRVVGYHPHEAGTTSAWWSDRIHPEDRPRAAAAMQAARERGAQYSHEYRVRHRDNTYRHVWDQGLVLRDGAGRAIRLVGCCVDITERVRAEEGLRFLAESSELLAASLDYETTLASVARLAVPHIADWCAVDLVGEDGRPHRLAVTHVDPEKVQWAHELEQRYPPDPNAPTGVPNVIRTGRAELYSEIPDELLVLAARDEEHLRIIRELGMTSAMIVPLFARGRALGAISFISAESGRRYGAADRSRA